MPPQQSQPNNLPAPQGTPTPPQAQSGQPATTPQSAAVGLGVINHLNKFLLPQKGAEGGSNTPQNAPGQAQTPPSTEQGGQNQEDVKTQMSGLETRLMDELQTLKTETQSQSDAKKELADLKKAVDTILNSND